MTQILLVSKLVTAPLKRLLAPIFLTCDNFSFGCESRDHLYFSNFVNCCQFLYMRDMKYRLRRFSFDWNVWDLRLSHKWGRVEVESRYLLHPIMGGKPPFSGLGLNTNINNSGNLYIIFIKARITVVNHTIDMNCSFRQVYTKINLTISWI